MHKKNDIHNRKGLPDGILKPEGIGDEGVTGSELRIFARAHACLRAGMKLLTPGAREKTHPQPLPVREGRDYLDGVMREK